MAVTVRTYTLSPGWNSNTVLDMLQTALADVGYHAPAQIGMISAVSTTASTTLPTKAQQRYLVRGTGGTGGNATFDIVRDRTGAPTVTLVKQGKNYSNNDVIQISGADVGGTIVTDNVSIQVTANIGISFGSTTTWFDVDTSAVPTWAVACVNNDDTKKMGQTYYAFSIGYLSALGTAAAASQTIGFPVGGAGSPILYIRAFPGFNPLSSVGLGVSGLDYVSTAVPNSITQQTFSVILASSNQVPLTLKTYQSAIDTNFVVWQFSEQSAFGQIFRNPFILSKYSNSIQPWSLDDCYTAGIYDIAKVPISNTYDAAIVFQFNTASMPKRQGEYGYYGGALGAFSSPRFFQGFYESCYGKKYFQSATASTSVPAFNNSIYFRSNNDLVHTSTTINYNPVITGLPICPSMIPTPYFIPADFGITEIVGTNNVGYGDKVTVSGQEWTILQYSNNQNPINTTLYNSGYYMGGIAFVARTVG